MERNDEDMAEKKGNLSITSENIFPIIKKWMYSDQDIFIRELISNGCDAVTKLKKLEMMENMMHRHQRQTEQRARCSKAG